MITINRKPMSVNHCFTGKRFKTDAYRQYRHDLLWLLPKIELPQPPYELSYVFGYSNMASDIDNCVKTTTDIIAEKYNFNDTLIHKITVEKVKAEKGKEFFKFSIKEYQNS